MAWYRIKTNFAKRVGYWGKLHKIDGDLFWIRSCENSGMYWFKLHEIELLPDEFGDLDEASKKLYLEL